MWKSFFALLVFLSGTAQADCFVFKDFEGTEAIESAQLCYTEFKSELVSFQLVYKNGRTTDKVTELEMRVEGSETGGTLIHGIEAQGYWMMVEWHSDSITVFDEEANKGSFLDLKE
ncbi:MAG: hypothetical protein KDD61_18255 [Bdellovibrionales bacterium]|nr:hypothetical protein [Bdellovibrionales bacterium]